MDSTAPVIEQPTITMPDAGVLCAALTHAHILSADGMLEELSIERARQIIHQEPFIVCHAPWVAGRLNVVAFPSLDILELFAFVYPAQFCVPTPIGIASFLGLPQPETLEEQCETLLEATEQLLSALSRIPESQKTKTIQIARIMQDAKWSWGNCVLSALGTDPAQEIPSEALNIWQNLPEWSEFSPVPPPGHKPVEEDEAQDRLQSLLHARQVQTGKIAEIREQQKQYIAETLPVFSPRKSPDTPNIVLAEAGTGTGKTLGYLAPSTLWAEKNDGPVWISTYTKNLQRQVENEIAAYYPDEKVRRNKVVVRKGRENYLCLLNFEDITRLPAIRANERSATAAGLIARWAMETKDGDIFGGDFPGWMGGLLGYHRTYGLADRRGECIHSACDHYHRCFVERAARKAAHADIVIANHALVMIQNALAGPEDILPGRIIFDEGHHLFEAADSAFAAHLTGQEMNDLRRWLLGNEGGRSRSRGIKRRVEDLITSDAKAIIMLEDIVQAAHILPATDWRARMKSGNPRGRCEEFLAAIRQHVLTQSANANSSWSIECDAFPCPEHVSKAAYGLRSKMQQLASPMKLLAAHLQGLLSDKADQLETDMRRRIESAASSLDRRATIIESGWLSMLDAIQKGITPDEFVDWFEIERIDGDDFDCGMYRHWVDPTKPFADSIKQHSHGLLVTSATLRDEGQNEPWNAARIRSGADHLLTPSPNGERGSYGECSINSPFDYLAQTKVFVITDVNKNDTNAVAAAYQRLFDASKGGALGLFTAIHRLRSVYKKIAGPMDVKDMPLYGQHVDEMDTGTLIDLFRAHENSCLLGTDAVRDGIDVPGKSLRMLVFDRVPWARPSILHRARRKAFGERQWDEMHTRFRLKQAYGRLIRKADDKGVFVMLDSALPSRMHSAFPEGVEIERLGLTEALREIRKFL